MEPSPEFAAFVRQHIRSVWALETLLILRSDPARRWSPAQLVRELRGSASLVAEVLKQLVAAGLVAPETDGCRYAPAAPALDALCEELAAAYAERPVAVVNLIARPADPLQSLADAFRLKGGDA